MNGAVRNALIAGLCGIRASVDGLLHLLEAGNDSTLLDDLGVHIDGDEECPHPEDQRTVLDSFETQGRGFKCGLCLQTVKE